MKKTISVLSVLLILTLCLTLTACGGKSDEKSTDSATEAPTEKAGYTIGATYKVCGAEIELVSVEDNAESEKTASGKWVLVTVKPKENQTLSQEDFMSYLADGKMTFGGATAVNFAPTTMDLVAGKMYISTDGVGIYFDVDKDLDVNTAELVVEEE